MGHVFEGTKSVTVLIAKHALKIRNFTAAFPTISFFSWGVFSWGDGDIVKMAIFQVPS